MPSERTKRIWGQDRRGADMADDGERVDRSPAADIERAKCKSDLKYFYQNVIANDVCDKRTGLSQSQSWGKVHDFLVDFLMFDTEYAHSPLIDLLPGKDDHGEFLERWIYFPTLNSSPVVQDGSTGPLSQLMYRPSKIWKGLLLRIKGDGLDKCVLMPRGHLKSTICTQAHTLWRIVRDPSESHLIRCLTGGLAKDFVGDIKSQFESNDKFSRLFGDLGPPTKRELPWNTEMIGVRTAVKRGKEATLTAMGMESEVTGKHYSRITLDDVVGETNSTTPGLIKEGCNRVERLESVRNPDTPMLDVGTRWDEQDAHSLFTAQDSERNASFVIATVKDEDGQPIWPEVYTNRVIERKERAMRTPRMFYGQYFNQFTGTSANTFSPKWLHNYQGTPEDCARNRKLNIYIGIDTASAKSEQSGRLDCTAALVLGQTQDRNSYCVLDGFNERLPAQDVIRGIVDLADKWRRIAAMTSATFEIGIEETAYTSFVAPALEGYMASRGITLFSITGLKHSNTSKDERIRTMAIAYSDNAVLWPETLVKPSLLDGTPYDLMVMLRDEFVNYHPGVHVDLLDAHAYAYQMCLPRTQAVESERAPVRDVSAFSRSDAIDREAAAVVGWNGNGDWRLSLG